MIFDSKMKIFWPNWPKITFLYSFKHLIVTISQHLKRFIELIEIHLNLIGLNLADSF